MLGPSTHVPLQQRFYTLMMKLFGPNISDGANEAIVKELQSLLTHSPRDLDFSVWNMLCYADRLSDRYSVIFRLFYMAQQDDSNSRKLLRTIFETVPFSALNWNFLYALKGSPPKKVTLLMILLESAADHQSWAKKGLKALFVQGKLDHYEWCDESLERLIKIDERPDDNDIPFLQQLLAAHPNLSVLPLNVIAHHIKKFMDDPKSLPLALFYKILCRREKHYVADSDDEFVFKLDQFARQCWHFKHTDFCEIDELFKHIELMMIKALLERAYDSRIKVIYDYKSNSFTISECNKVLKHFALAHFVPWATKPASDEKKGPLDIQQGSLVALFSRVSLADCYIPSQKEVEEIESYYKSRREKSSHHTARLATREYVAQQPLVDISRLFDSRQRRLAFYKLLNDRIEDALSELRRRNRLPGVLDCHQRAFIRQVIGQMKGDCTKEQIVAALEQVFKPGEGSKAIQAIRTTCCPPQTR